MDPSKPEKDKSSADEKKIRTNPAKLLAYGLMKRDQLAPDIEALYQDPKMAKVPLRARVSARLAATPTSTVTSTATNPNENVDMKYSNVVHVPPGNLTGIFKKPTRPSFSDIDEDENGDGNPDDGNATI